MRYAASSCVMVGVQGAGLQWAVFMPSGCTLIEIAWPSQHWGFHFRTYVEPYGIRHHALRAVNAKVNWAAYETHVRRGKQVGGTFIACVPASLRQYACRFVFFFVAEDCVILSTLYCSRRVRVQETVELRAPFSVICRSIFFRQKTKTRLDCVFVLQCGRAWPVNNADVHHELCGYSKICNDRF
jgi:hypothetical protein